jgi:dTDP-glucose pyrophosphorylase
MDPVATDPPARRSRRHERFHSLTFRQDVSLSDDLQMMTHKTLLILAAGMGSRYGGLKQMLPVGPGGETIIDYSVHDAIRSGFDKLVFVIRRDIEQEFRETIGSRFEKRVAVQYVFQELDCLPAGEVLPPNRRKPWGTGHAILMAAEAIREPFGVINADDFYGAHSFQLLAEHLQPGNPDYAMVGFVLRNTLSEFGSVARGVCQLTDGHLDSIREIVSIEKQGAAARYKGDGEEYHALTGGEIVSMNMWGFNPSLFDHLRRQFREFLRQRGADEKAEFYIPTVVNTLIRGGEKRVAVLQTRSVWFGVTYREDRPMVVEGINQLVGKGEYPERLWA